MSNHDLTKISKEKLNEIIGKHENPHVPGSRYNKALAELKKREGETSEKFKNTIATLAFEKADRLLGLIEHLVRKPKQAIWKAVAIAILIGTSINLLTKILSALLGF